VLESSCAAALGHPISRPIEFHLGMNLTRGGGLAWQELIAFLTTSQFINGAGQQNLVTSQLEQLLATTLLARQPHNYTKALSNPAPTPEIPYIRRAEEYILMHCHEPITMQDLARQQFTRHHAIVASIHRQQPLCETRERTHVQADFIKHFIDVMHRERNNVCPARVFPLGALLHPLQATLHMLATLFQRRQVQPAH